MSKKQTTESTQIDPPHMKTEEQSQIQPKIKTRLVTSLQSLGRIGKSTFTQSLMSWADFAGIPTAAIDADEEHRTLSGWYGDDVSFMPFRERDNLLPLIDAAGNAPLELIDFPAQSTDSILQGFEDFDGVASLASRGIRLTVALFASDERAGMLSAHKIISTLGDSVDYIIVTNPARFKSEAFEKSTIPSMIPKAARIHLGAITAYTLKNVDEAGKRKRQALTFGKALSDISDGSKSELQTWLNALFLQFEDVANVLLPDPSLIQNRVARNAKPARKVVSAFDL